MPEVEFKEEWRPQRFVPQKGWGEKMARWLVNHSGGLIKDETQASYVILGIVSLIVIVSIIIFWKGTGGVKPINSITTPDVIPR